MLPYSPRSISKTRIIQRWLRPWSASTSFGDADLIAPQFLLYELPNAILAAVRRQRIGRDRADEAIADFFALSIPTVGDDATLSAMLQAAYALGQDAGCTLYDALYLVVAQESGRPLMTADERLLRGLGNKLAYVQWLGDYDPDAIMAST